VAGAAAGGLPLGAGSGEDPYLNIFQSSFFTRLGKFVQIKINLPKFLTAPTAAQQPAVIGNRAKKVIILKGFNTLFHYLNFKSIIVIIMSAIAICNEYFY
jgi:hypothetical protein